ncbi:hypothetical protein AVEN_215542-1 [Araneus ventricosus]|uniref:Uncharacterized protein n=1 Tax=Araneus ventricosus TaxID=182803 RepID=A0A4Y2BFQ0_ARAVE|nr:hypothetical protein AVEN_215542-1 [Araneus ventricosus]
MDYGGHKRMLQHLSQTTKQPVQQPEESNTKDHLATATEELQKAIFTACRKAYKIKKLKIKINNNWWNQNLQRKKKELQAVKRRTNSQEDNKREYQKKTRAKKSVEEGNEEFFPEHLHQKKDPYVQPYKSVVKNKYPQAEILKHPKQWRYQIASP